MQGLMERNLSNSEWSLYPSQDNGFDCDVFVIKFMESLFNRELAPLMVIYCIVSLFICTIHSKDYI